MLLNTLVDFLDGELELAKFSRDYSNNGLQVEGKQEISKAVFSVDASLELFEEASARNADFIFVHHGLSWGSEPRRFTGMTARRLNCLFNAGISLYAAHLPLDAHGVFGNNAQLADMIGLKERETFFEYSGVDIGFSGCLKDAPPCGAVSEFLGKKLAVTPMLWGDAEKSVRKAAIVSGGGGLDCLLQAAERGCDLLITGEFDHTMYHPRKELDINVIALGHYASETVGPYALMEHVQKTLALACEFIHIPTTL